MQSLGFFYLAKKFYMHYLGIFKWIMSSLVNQFDAGSASSDISSAILEVQVLTLPKHEVFIPTKKLKFVSVVLEEILCVAGSCIFTLL
jgi:hypothetical protein